MVLVLATVLIFRQLDGTLVASDAITEAYYQDEFRYMGMNSK